MIFSSNFFRLEIGIFHPNIGEKKRFDIGNTTVKRPKISPAYRLLSKYMKQTIIMSRIGLVLVLQQQQNLGRRFGTSKMHLSPPVA